MKHTAVVFIIALALALSYSGCSGPGDTPTEMDIFAQHNLIAWCIVPYDAKERTPRERARMLPYLRTVNLNGMEPEGPHILTIGKGSKDAEMIAALKSSGFTGTIGIIGHTEGEDVREVLARNMNGLNTILGELSRNTGAEGSTGRIK
jgi:hypothetical protein